MFGNTAWIDEEASYSGAAVADRSEAGRARLRGDRRMALLQQAGLFGSDTKGAVIRRAVSLGDLRKAYRLVHDTFVRRDLAAAGTGGLRVGPFEALPTTATFVAAVGDEVVGVQSLAVDSAELRLPADEDFRDEIDFLRFEGRLICEATNQAVAFAYRRSAIPTELMRCLFAQALAAGCDEIITVVKPGHVVFYRMLGFEPIGAARRCACRHEKVGVLLRLNIPSLIRRAEGVREDRDSHGLFLKVRCLCSNPYRERVGPWEDESRQFFADPQGLRQLFVEESGLLDRCTEEERFVVCLHWGDEVFAKARQFVN
jgi:hypothetical protein